METAIFLSDEEIDILERVLDKFIDEHQYPQEKAQELLNKIKKRGVEEIENATE